MGGIGEFFLNRYIKGFKRRTPQPPIACGITRSIKIRDAVHYNKKDK
jgi:hypothetical protein